MPMNDWTRVDAGIYHAFHHSWIEEIARALNGGRLPEDYYALAEQHAAGFGPDVLTLQSRSGDPDRDDAKSKQGSVTLTRSRPQTRFVFESPAEFYRRKKKSVAVRHVSDDRLVAMLEIMSPGNKDSTRAFKDFLNKAFFLLEERIHLLIIDPFPPGKRDPQGIHAAIWDEADESAFQLPPGKPLTLVSYECDLTTRAYVETVGVGDPLPDMPLFLEPEENLMVPLEATYSAAFAVMPQRWRKVIE